MTITLTQAIHESGAVVSAGTTITRAADVEADLVARGFATPVGLAPGVAAVGANLVSQLAEAYRSTPFTNFAPRMLASLVASSTAACTSGVVTVTATSHGLPATSFDGFGFYYPGSPSLAAGFYESFSRTGANTITFAAPLSPDFGSESVNAGAAFTAEVTLASVDIGANAIVPPSMVSVRAMRIGDGGASTKTLRLKIGGTAMATNLMTATSNGAVDMAFSALSSNKQIAHGGPGLVGALSAFQVFGAVDLTAATTISLTGQISAAGGYMMISSPLMMVE